MNFPATLEGVQGHIVSWQIADNTQPTASDVNRWLEQYDAVVALRLGPLDVFSRSANTADELEATKTAASKIVELGATADTIDAAYPERASRVNNDLGNVFRQRYAAELDALTKQVEKRRSEILAGDTSGDGSSGAPAWYSSPPSFARDRPW